MAQPREKCGCFRYGFRPNCPHHFASVRSRCEGWQTYDGLEKPRCMDDRKGCNWCWEKYRAMIQARRLIRFYHLDKAFYIITEVR